MEVLLPVHSEKGFSFQFPTRFCVHQGNDYTAIGNRQESSPEESLDYWWGKSCI
jgi:hypothetical protein